ncbi:uncharacterized protein L969DRAFT_100231 [Mixia osmundae IAM 14324]|uniref:uncharacterized protein n=1 Tax=Mixia osmundae (strain CBS 9802 / IAM 14324 / JCM 22182 / KY 12970) TaxID=764103 RepID=UPI0004A54BDC|nr:uncharacterized protein L969DRAFT_100231 [Mixia osmundae IAM 14324]KEI36553.1 hypothetical protein L969DRAFT_100231 [Mixia osmundae IAM 14324]
MSGRFVARASPALDSLEQQLSRRAHYADLAAARPASVAQSSRSSSRARTRANSPEPDDGSPKSARTPRSSGFDRSVTNQEEQWRTKDARPPQTDAEPEHRLGTFAGVYMPVCLNVVGLILFLRFGFILGQAGLVGVLILLLIALAIDALTTMSVSAIASAGNVRSGGPYYLASRSLGVEAGGSMGLVFYFAQVFNIGLNVLGFVEALTDTFGVSKEATTSVLPEGPWWQFLYGSVLLFCCTALCLIGSSAFNRAQSLVACAMLLSIISIPISAVLKRPFVDPIRHTVFTGFSLDTFRENLLWRFTRSSAGQSHSKETWMSVFAVLFPACNGILAGTSMSGSLRKPSKSIPKGTVWGLVTSFGVYVVVMMLLAATVSRESLNHDLAILQDVNVLPGLIVLGVLCSTFFSALLGITACAKILQAISRDDLLPALAPFSQGTEQHDEPLFAIIATYVLAQAVLLIDNVNYLASFVTSATLLAFGIINLACFVLKATGCTNFRPAWRFFSTQTALAGAVLSFGGMFFTDPLIAALSIIVMIALVMLLHLQAPPKPWGDFTQGLLYHQVRKYLLRLSARDKLSVKFWRPQILLLTDNPRHAWQVITFCNALKKGGLFVLGHVLLGDFCNAIEELKRQKLAWLRLVNVSGIKAFVDMTVAVDERIGAQNLMLSAGIGGMRPNIVIVGFPERAAWRRKARQRQDVDVRSHSSAASDITVRPADDDSHIDVLGSLPTDANRAETPISATNYVGILEDVIALECALGIAYNFPSLDAPTKSEKISHGERRYIDLWPLLSGSDGFETYTMVLQLGLTLSMVDEWQRHRLRVTVFVEYAEEVADERNKIQALLDSLRIRAELRVLFLRTGRLSSYETLVNGRDGMNTDVESALAGDKWWEAYRTLRQRTADLPDLKEGAPIESVSKSQETRTHEWNKLVSTLSSSIGQSKLRITAPGPIVVRDVESETSIFSGEELSTEQALRATIAQRIDPSRKRHSMSALPDEPARKPLLTSSFRRYGTQQVTSSSPSRLPQPSARSPMRQTTRQPSGLSRMMRSPSGNERVMPDSQMTAEPESASSFSLAVPSLGFNDLPMRAQFVILNELLRQNSDESTSIIFTSNLHCLPVTWLT